MVPLKNACAKVNITDLIFAHWLIMGRSQKWPDLRSPISKIQDIRFVGTDDLIIFRKFHNVPWNIVAVARWESYFVVGSLDLTWWPDLTWPWAEIFKNVAEKMGGKVGENPAALRAAVFSLSSKNLRGGGRSNAPPPAGRGLIGEAFFFFNTDNRHPHNTANNTLTSYPAPLGLWIFHHLLEVFEHISPPLRLPPLLSIVVESGRRLRKAR